VFELDLYLRGVDLKPDALTSLLGVTPTETRTRGVSTVSRTGRSYETKVGLWNLKVEGGTPSECVAALATRFGGQIRDLSGLPGVEDAFLDVFVTLDLEKPERTEVPIEFDPAALAQLAAFRVPLVVTFAAVGERLITQPPTDESVFF